MILKIYRPTKELNSAYNDLEDAYFRYKQLGHFARDCLETPKTKADIKELAELAIIDSDSEKE